MDKDLRQEIQTELDKLHKNIEAMRQESNDQSDIEQRTNLFQMDWLDRLIIEQRAEMRGAKAGVETAFEELARQEHQQRQQQDMKDAQQLPKMSAEDQVAFWGNRSGEPNTFREQERAREIEQAMNATEKSINDSYATLRYDLVKAVQQIEVGDKPNLTPQVAQKMENEQPSNSLDELKKSEVGSDDFKAALQKEKEAIDRLRDEEQKIAHQMKR